MKKNFIVTGGAGFIGSHLVELLTTFGHRVIVIDDLSSGYEKNLNGISGDIIFNNCQVQNFDFNKLDKIECVFHLAAQASVPYSIDNFVESSTKNMVSTFTIINYCTEKEIPLVYATSSAVYGNLPMGKENIGIDLLSPYAADKYCMEMYANASYNLKGLRSFGLRFFNVYGPRQDASNPYSGVISIFIDRLLNNDSITINGGHQTRDFVYVKDVVNTIFKSYEHLLFNKVANISNVLTGNSITINDLVKSISNILKIDPICIYKELPPGDPECSLGSIELMEKLLNIKANSFKSIEYGLKETIEYIKLVRL